MVTGEDIISGRMAIVRSLKYTTMVEWICRTASKKKTLQFWDDNERVEEGKVDRIEGLLQAYLLLQ